MNNKENIAHGQPNSPSKKPLPKRPRSINNSIIGTTIEVMIMFVLWILLQIVVFIPKIKHGIAYCLRWLWYGAADEFVLDTPNCEEKVTTPSPPTIIMQRKAPRLRKSCLKSPRSSNGDTSNRLRVSFSEDRKAVLILEK
eukprot:TRINITY_DN1361_c0_g1_i1.p1 TRINITY_DN1361_c0_g1~~TRINITY_DN1361_c0_g1_i1.p1  ORF type:complete len:155 (+),score=7.44 TRINITY_DN1361_c0_g1_i1:46-465(+)